MRFVGSIDPLLFCVLVHERFEIPVRHDFFDAAVIEVRRTDLEEFIEALHSGLFDF